MPPLEFFERRSLWVVPGAVGMPWLGEFGLPVADSRPDAAEILMKYGMVSVVFEFLFG